MRGCLFTLLLGAVVVGLVVFLGLPAAASGLITGGLTAAGLQADDTTVTVKADPPTDLLSGTADRVVVHATDARFRGLEIGSLDIALEDVDVLGRRAGSVEGTLTGVVLPERAGGITLDEVGISGSADAVVARTTVGRADVEARIADAIEDRTGVRPTAVTLAGPDRLTIKAAGETITGRIRAQDGDLVVAITDGPGAGSDVVVLRGGEGLPMEITKVRVTEGGGLRIEGGLTVGLLG